MSEWIDPAEAMRLVAQPGVVTNVRLNGIGLNGHVSDGDILVQFDLPDGASLHYVAEIESDYYGGSYTHIRWEIERAK